MQRIAQSDILIYGACRKVCQMDGWKGPFSDDYEDEQIASDDDIAFSVTHDEVTVTPQSNTSSLTDESPYSSLDFSIGPVKFEASGSISGNIDAGIVFEKDMGIQGLAVKVATVNLLKLKHDSHKGFSSYYVGKNGIFKGSGPAFKIETGVFDIKGSSKWNNKTGISKKIGIGKPFFESKVDNGAIYFGVQEDFGFSAGYYRIFGIAVTLDIRSQLKISLQ